MVLRLIDRGGQAIVYEAVQKSTNRRMALKVFLLGLTGADRHARRFEREVDLLVGLRHPGIVTVYDSGTTADGHPFIAMDYLEGRRLDVWALEELGLPCDRRSVRRLLELFAEACEAVRHAHQQGVIHRDLKPGNILIDADGIPHVLDFGLAKATSASDSRGLTVTGEFFGTLAYAAPEQVSGHPDRMDTRADVFALGVILYELLTRELPHSSDGAVADVVRRISGVVPAPPSALNPALDEELDTIVLKALSKEPDRRYHSAAELLDDVRRYLAGEAISAKRDSTWYVLRKTLRHYRLPLAAAGTFVAMLFVFSVWMALLYGRAHRAEDAAVQTAQDLTASLTVANIERGRMMNVTDNVPLAEELVWREFFASPHTDIPTRATSASLPTSPAYWALWEIYRRNPCLATAHLNNGQVLAIAFAHDEKSILTTGSEGTICRWDPATWRKEDILTLKSPSEPESVFYAFLDDAKRIMRVKANTLEIWDLSDGTRINQFSDPQFNNARPVVSGDGKAVAFLVMTNEVALFDLEDLDHPRRFRVTGEHLIELAISLDRRRLAAASRDGTIRLLEATSGKEISVTKIEHTKDLGGLQFSADGTRLGLRAGYLAMVLDTRLLAQLGVLRGHVSNVKAIAFDPMGHRLVTVSNDKTVRLWDVERVALCAILSGHNSATCCAAFSSDGRLVASGDDSGVVKLWEVAPNSCFTHVMTPGCPVNSIAYSPDGSLLATVGGDKGPQGEQSANVQLWDARTFQSKTSFAGHTETVSAVAFSPDGSRLATSSFDGTIRIWNLFNGEQVGLLDLGARVNRLDFSRDGRWLVSGSDDAFVRLWDARDGRLFRAMALHRKRVPSVAFSPDCRTFASTGMDGIVGLWNVDSEAPRAVLDVPTGPARVVRFSPDGRIVATGSDDWLIRLWDPETGTLRRTLTGHRQSVLSLAFSSDGALLVSGDWAGFIHLWDVESGRNLAKFESPSTGYLVMDLAFSPDGRHLAVAMASGGFGVWDLSYYDRHIAGNLEYQITRLPGEERVAKDFDAFRSWASRALSGEDRTNE